MLLTTKIPLLHVVSEPRDTLRKSSH